MSLPAGVRPLQLGHMSLPAGVRSVQFETWLVRTWLEGLGSDPCSSRRGSSRRGDPGPGLCEAFVQRMLGLPAELAFRERDVEDAALELARPGVRELRLALH